MTRTAAATVARAVERVEAEIVQYRRKNERLRDELNDAKRTIKSMQAKIDSLMLEYCPEEMAPAQIEEWGRHQEPDTPRAKR